MHLGDEIFLLSKEEYREYKNIIPWVNVSWWLRTPTELDRSDHAMAVTNIVAKGEVDTTGIRISTHHLAVRPAIRLTDWETGSVGVGENFTKYSFPWVYVGNHIAVSEVPIAFRCFDMTSNNYETSNIRAFIKEWLADRKSKETKTL